MKDKLDSIFDSFGPSDGLEFSPSIIEITPTCGCGFSNCCCCEDTATFLEGKYNTAEKTDKKEELHKRYSNYVDSKGTKDHKDVGVEKATADKAFSAIHKEKNNDNMENNKELESRRKSDAEVNSLKKHSFSGSDMEVNDSQRAYSVRLHDKETGKTHTAQTTYDKRKK